MNGQELLDAAIDEIFDIFDGSQVWRKTIKSVVKVNSKGREDKIRTCITNIHYLIHEYADSN